LEAEAGRVTVTGVPSTGRKVMVKGGIGSGGGEIAGSSYDVG